MRIGCRAGRAVAVVEGGLVDVAHASDGSLPSDVREVIGRLGEVQALLAANPSLSHEAPPGSVAEMLGPPLEAPGQVFAVGLNYRTHSAETGMTLPRQPMVFTKFPSSITGPTAPIALPSRTVDWEVELVVVIGRRGRDIKVEDSWSHVAGLCVGQDISERTSQMADSPPQFSLAKSYAGFAPIGPWMTTLDDIANPADLEIRCELDGEVVQRARTRDMIFGVPELIEFISQRCELRIGDLIFTGTPEGVGFSRNPPRYLEPGSLLVSEIEGLGQLSNPLRSPRPGSGE